MIDSTDRPIEAQLAECMQALAVAVTALTAATRSTLPGELLTADELAERIRIPSRTLRDLASAGRIPHHRLGKHYRFSVDDIVEILQLTKQEPRARRTRSRVARAA